jgi:hypothetical protein
MRDAEALLLGSPGTKRRRKGHTDVAEPAAPAVAAAWEGQAEGDSLVALPLSLPALTHPGIAPVTCRAHRTTSSGAAPPGPLLPLFAEPLPGTLPLLQRAPSLPAPGRAKRELEPAAGATPLLGPLPLQLPPLGGGEALPTFGRGLPNVASKDPLDLLAQAACDALASPVAGQQAVALPQDATTVAAVQLVPVAAAQRSSPLRAASPRHAAGPGGSEGSVHSGGVAWRRAPERAGSEHARAMAAHEAAFEGRGDAATPPAAHTDDEQCSGAARAAPPPHRAPVSAPLRAGGAASATVSTQSSGGPLSSAAYAAAGVPSVVPVATARRSRRVALTAPCRLPPSPHTASHGGDAEALLAAEPESLDWPAPSGGEPPLRAAGSAAPPPLGSLPGGGAPATPSHQAATSSGATGPSAATSWAPRPPAPSDAAAAAPLPSPALPAAPLLLPVQLHSLPLSGLDRAYQAAAQATAANVSAAASLLGQRVPPPVAPFALPAALMAPSPAGTAAAGGAPPPDAGTPLQPGAAAPADAAAVAGPGDEGLASLVRMIRMQLAAAGAGSLPGGSAGGVAFALQLPTATPLIVPDTGFATAAAALASPALGLLLPSSLVLPRLNA